MGLRVEHISASAFKSGAAGARLRGGDVDAIIVTGRKGRQVPRPTLAILPPPVGEVSRAWVSDDGGVFGSEADAREWLAGAPNGAGVYETLLVPVREVEP